MPPLLSIRNLKVRFETTGGAVEAVGGLGYDLNDGETLAIVGESGSGKSVHALAILGLLPPPPVCRVEGQILFNGENLLGLAASPLRRLRGNRIAMIFQEPMSALNPVLTIGEQVAEPLMVHENKTRAEALKEAARLLEKVGIPEAEKRLKNYPHQLSGGMRQRAMIAMALSCGPDILIADEPTTALDATIQAQILELLKSLQKELAMAILLITHNIGVVADMARRIIIMYAGRIVETGSAADILSDPRHPYTRGLLGAVPSLDSRKRERLAAIPGRPPDPRRKFPGCPFSPRCAEAQARCREWDPPLFDLGNGRASNCWLSEGAGTPSKAETR